MERSIAKMNNLRDEMEDIYTNLDSARNFCFTNQILATHMVCECSRTMNLQQRIKMTDGTV